MQDAVGIFVAEHQFSHLPSFKSYGWIPEVGLTLEMEGLIFGDDGDANLRRLRDIRVAAADKTGRRAKQPAQVC